MPFGDGAKGRILANGDIVGQHRPRPNDVRYVEGLTANLISISQLCDQGYTMNFCKENCVVTDGCNVEIMRGIRQSNNCYHWSSNETKFSNLTKEGLIQQ